jgi:hypothetical protein
VVDVPALVAACTDRWYNQTLCRANDSVVRLGVVQGRRPAGRRKGDRKPAGPFSGVGRAVGSPAGCGDAAILGHCRTPGEHVRGCWVVDLLTGRR